MVGTLLAAAGYTRDNRASGRGSIGGGSFFCLILVNGGVPLRKGLAVILGERRRGLPEARREPANLSLEVVNDDAVLHHDEADVLT